MHARPGPRRCEAAARAQPGNTVWGGTEADKAQQVANDAIDLCGFRAVRGPFVLLAAALHGPRATLGARPVFLPFFLLPLSSS